MVCTLETMVVASAPRLRSVAANWRPGSRDRRGHERRAERVRVVAIDPTEEREPTPLGPSIDFMAHVLGQGVYHEDCTHAVNAYAARGSQRYACGVCADE